MKETEVKKKAFAMPLTSPAYPIGPNRFYHREFLIITYRTDPQKLRELVPEPLQVEEPLVKFEFIRMPDSTGFGDYTESGQVIPVTLNGKKGGYSHCMFLNDHPPIAGDSLWILLDYHHLGVLLGRERSERSGGVVGSIRPSLSPSSEGDGPSSE